MHSEVATGEDTKKPADEEISAQIDLLKSADVMELNELDWRMKRTNYRAVVNELAEASKTNGVYGLNS